MTQSAKSGPEKDKGYWQAIANYNYAVAQDVAKLPLDVDGVEMMLDVEEHREAHPEFGEFLSGLATIHQAISDTYGVPIEEVTADIEALDEAHDLLVDLHDLGQDWNDDT